MKNLKVWLFHPTVRNTLVFVFLSLLFVVVQRSLHAGLPFVNATFLEASLREEWVLVAAAIPLVLSLVRHHRSLVVLFPLFVALVTYRSLEGIFLNFNKVLLVVLFVYVCIAYMLHQLMSASVRRASFTPNYAPSVLGHPIGVRLPVTLTASGEQRVGYLTNWDHEGAFVWLEDAWHAGRGVTLAVSAFGVAFQAKGTVVATAWDNRGIGVELERVRSFDGQGWDALIELLDDRGFQPALLR